MPSLQGTVVRPINLVRVVAVVTPSLNDDAYNGPENEEADSNKNNQFGCHNWYNFLRNNIIDFWAAKILFIYNRFFPPMEISTRGISFSV
jgi:hypothetical protein